MEAEALDDEFDTQNLAGIADKRKGRREQSSSVVVNIENEEDLTDSIKA